MSTTLLQTKIVAGDDRFTKKQDRADKPTLELNVLCRFVRTILFLSDSLLKYADNKFRLIQ